MVSTNGQTLGATDILACLRIMNKDTNKPANSLPMASQMIR